MMILYESMKMEVVLMDKMNETTNSRHLTEFKNSYLKEGEEIVAWSNGYIRSGNRSAFAREGVLVVTET